MKGPVLLLAVRTDGFVTLKTQRQLIRKLGSAEKRLVVLPSGGAGWDLFNLSPFADRALRLTVRFVKRVAG